MALRQLIATITVHPRQQAKVCEWLRGFDTDLARDGLITWEPRGFCFAQGVIVWSVISIGASSARQIKRRLATHLKPYDCQMEWKSLIDGYLYDVNMCNCKPTALLLHVGLATRHEVIRCGGCRGLVALTSLPLSVELRQGLTAWADDYHHVQMLWLASGDFEVWAGKQMDRPNSKLNANGMSLAAEVEKVTGVPTYYWLHSYRVSKRIMQQPLSCLKCGQPFTSNEFGSQKELYVCETCRIVWPEPVDVV